MDFIFLSNTMTVLMKCHNPLFYLGQVSTILGSRINMVLRRGSIDSIELGEEGCRRIFGGKILYWWRWEKPCWEYEELHDGEWVYAGIVEGDWKCTWHFPFLDELWGAMQLAS